MMKNLKKTRVSDKDSSRRDLFFADISFQTVFNNKIIGKNFFNYKRIFNQMSKKIFPKKFEHRLYISLPTSMSAVKLRFNIFCKSVYSTLTPLRAISIVIPHIIYSNINIFLCQDFFYFFHRNIEISSKFC